MKIHRLTTGRVRGPRRPRGARRYVRLEWSDTSLPVHAFLVEHDDSLTLVDAGQSALAAQPGYLPRWHPFLRTARFELTADDEVVRHVERLGFAAADVRRVVMTHLHTDHVGGLGPFRSAEVIVSGVEWARATGRRGAIRGYVPKQWPAGLEPLRIAVDGPAIGPFSGSYSLTADDSMCVVPLPGHTPGQIGLLLRTTRAALIGGDVAHDLPELEQVAPEIAAYCRAEDVRFLAAHDDAIPPLVELG